MIPLEDIVLGAPIELGRHTFDADAIKAFAARFDPQPFHMDEAAARASHFGGLCASGWHVTAVWMRLLVDHHRREDEVLRARGEPVALLGPSPGIRDLRWLRPVHAGDTIRYVSEPVEARASGSRPGWGLLTVRTTGINQRGEPAVSFVSVVFVERRKDAAS